MSLSQNIKTIRMEKGLTQEQLAAQLGVSPQAVSKWETSETYPDGAILCDLARALDTSLDVLFDNPVHSVRDISSRIRDLMADTPGAEQFHVIRDLCWQIEKALFHSRSSIGWEYVPDELQNVKNHSYILNDHGFTHVSNGTAPFFSVFPAYGNNFAEAIGDGEEMRKIFAALSSPDTMKAVLFILRCEEKDLFEGEYLAEACGIEAASLDGVMDALCSLHLASRYAVEIDGEMRSLYYATPTHTMIALLLFAKELNYRGSYSNQSHFKGTPFLK